jgi:hypothetical protein
MVTADGAGASHGLIERLDALARRPGYQLIYSVGWELGERERTAITAVPDDAWQIAVNHRGEIRERRADNACADRGCGHRKCWVEEAHVSELTALLRQGPAGDQLAGWPAPMRVFARRERPYPGAQLTLFEAADGWRYSLWVTNLPATAPGLARPDRLHRRRPPGPRPGRGLHPHRQGHRHRPLPQPLLRAQPGLAGRRPDRRRPAGLAAAARPGRASRQSRAQDPALPPPAHRRPPDHQQPPQAPQDRRYLALGTSDHHRLGTDHSPAAGPLTSSGTRPGDQERTQGPVEPHPARQPGRRHTPALKSRSTTRRRPSQASDPSA